MRVSITRGQRSLLLFLSASGYIAWLAGVDARIEAQDLVGTRVASMIISPPPAIPNVSNSIKRDPFAGSPNVTGHAPVQPGAAPPESDVPAAVPNASDAGVTVPDIGVAADGAPPSVPAAPVTLTVRATIVGRTSVAYVANGSAMDIVRVGDTLGERRIAKIDLEGIAFTDGTRLDLAGSYEATPAPLAPRKRSISIPLDQLRKLLAQPSPSATAGPDSTARTATPTSTPAPAVTPEPIRTVNSAGIAPGTNPTPDLTDPTAYPYPYPYPAPAHR